MPASYRRRFFSEDAYRRRRNFAVCDMRGSGKAVPYESNIEAKGERKKSINKLTCVPQAFSQQRRLLSVFPKKLATENPLYSVLSFLALLYFLFFIIIVERRRLWNNRPMSYLTAKCSTSHDDGAPAAVLLAAGVSEALVIAGNIGTPYKIKVGAGRKQNSGLFICFSNIFFQVIVPK